MSRKIYSLKKWLSLEDAAKRLTLELSEEISIADVLHLVIDDQLRISVNFPHDWHGKFCDITEDENKAFEFKEAIGIDGEIFQMYEYEKCSETEYIKIEPEIYSFKSGIYEVKKIGNSKIDIEYLFKQEYGLTAADVFNLSGFYIYLPNGKVVERQSYSQYKPKIQEGFKNTIFEGFAENSIPVTKEQLNEVFTHIEKKMDLIVENFYYPCSGIGDIEGAFFVIQSEHIGEFLNGLKNDDDTQKTITGKSETAYLNIIQVLKDELINREFKNQDELIKFLADKYTGYTGLSETNLRDKFAKANKI